MNDNSKRMILQKAKNIAILGLSPDESKPSHQVARYLVSQGFNIIPIYPRGGEILGFKAFASLDSAFSDENLREIGEINILNIFRKSEALAEVAKEILTLKNRPQCVWVQLGLESAEAKARIENAGLLYVENCCIALEHERLLGEI